MSDYSHFGGIDLAKNHFSLHVVDQKEKLFYISRLHALSC
jgi:transposase